jgi:hypothetical protein
MVCKKISLGVCVSVCVESVGIETKFFYALMFMPLCAQFFIYLYSLSFSVTAAAALM